MTLTELLVSMAILSLMILVVSSIVVRTRKVVETAEDAIRANTDVRAIANRLHEDLAGTTKEGFLAVAYDAGNLPLPHLVLTNVSTFRSVMLGLSANFARIDYGLSPQPQGALWRRAYLHDPVFPLAGFDVIKATLSDYRLFDPATRSPRVWVHTILSAVGGCLTPPTMTVPPLTLTDYWSLWPYMSGSVTQVRLQWTDGTKDGDGRMRWYDKDNPKCRYAESNRDLWKDRDAGFQDANMNSDRPEYNLDGANANPGRYCALWTFRKKDNWPKAIRIQVWVGTSRRFYEVDLGLPE